MTVAELRIKLALLTPKEQQLPVCFMDEVWLHEVGFVQKVTGNEFGVNKDDLEHIRLVPA